MQEPRLRASLFALNAVAAATVLRSLLFDRWITLIAGIFLMVGVSAARRGNTWGIGLTLGAAAYFPTAWALGIAPSWFCLVGLLGALPFALTMRPLARFDKAATALGATLAIGSGAFTAIAFRAVAPFLFMNFPASRPTFEMSHMGLVAALATLAAMRMMWRRATRPVDAGQSMPMSASHVRVAMEPNDESHTSEHELALELEASHRGAERKA